MTIDQGIALAITWLRRIGSIFLLAFVILTLARLMGFNLYPVGSAGFQELGVFVAGAAYALSK